MSTGDGEARAPALTQRPMPAGLHRRDLLPLPTLVLALRPPRAVAQARYPSRPVQLLVPWAAGGGTDVVARMIASLLERDLGQPFVVVNRTSGGGGGGPPPLPHAPPPGPTLRLLAPAIAKLPWSGRTQAPPPRPTPPAPGNQETPRGL